ncbi:MAG: error-prone DNA polymerase [Rhodospirillaceae bacterium]|nr:error-prone DNA polymerase [Rhodospirillaceae bacterium]MYF87778.1 error-prone DNA polymerase [Rhodospirillaceae bacterium]MYH37444.1 error-prone DNA polymerase [Rhodospirillaceae bacterium]MYK13698.1 error-prone DNA polymerase [Rhodospirillaceae bacterium]MYK59151.1 error-prone DNA polymerase [Rhodospirillaceae bacterium]
MPFDSRPGPGPVPAYAELQVTTNFSFLRGGSHPEELVMRAAELGYRAIGIADRNTLAGVVRAHSAAERAGLTLLVGARLDLQDGVSLLCFPQDKPAYARLSGLLTLGKRRAEKGDCHLRLADLPDLAGSQCVVVLPPDGIPECDPPDRAAGENGSFSFIIKQIADLFQGNTWLAASCLYRGDDARRLDRLAGLAAAAGVPLVATNDVHYHVPARRPLQDVLTCIREHCTLDEAGFRLFDNAERHLKPPQEMANLFHTYPYAIHQQSEIVEKISFSLDQLKYVYPVDPIPEGRTPQQELERLTWRGAAERYGRHVPDRVRAALAHELALIGQLGYAPYFLTVHDIVRFARGRKILCQGRGSAANSAVCYCLGITAVDPGKVDLLFERFVSAERNEPPDIDVDFEHERREEVIQYIYAKYGRHRAGLTATVVSYRPRSAIREVGKALGLSEDTVDILARTVWGWSDDGLKPDYIRQTGLDPADPTLRRALLLALELVGFPRHLSQHTGGFVITDGPLHALAPIENAAMEDRTVVEWDKDDLDTLGILKIDVLSLGMLTCIRKGFDLLARHYGRRHDLATVPADDSAVYDMICKADTLGVFQIESRAQMSMLPRLKPRDFYDLVIEVAIVRPGPIQGDMVHPYLRRRNGEERVDFPSRELEDVLGKTLGVPLFQEQAMKVAIVAAGFTPSEADQLRRAMATFRKTGKIHGFRTKMVEGMVARGYERDFAERCFRQIEGFGDYGFPESHAASFALLVYVSAWLKCHYPAAFACALLNSQPMGFYAPAQIVRDAREHGVEVRPVDVNRSGWDNALEPGADGAMALRLGFRQVKGLREEAMERLVAARGNGYPDPWTLWRRAGLPAAVLERLARADAFGSLGLDRRRALWAVRRFRPAALPLFAAMDEDEQPGDPPAALPAMTLGEQVVDDYASVRMTLRAHPLALLRGEAPFDRATRHGDLLDCRNGQRVEVAGLVLIRQRPGTAKGVVFMTLEDETGAANVIVWPHALERYRPVVMGARLVRVVGEVQKEGLVIHIVARRLEDLSARLDGLGRLDAAFDPALAHADEIAREVRDPRESKRDPRRDRLHKRMYPSRDFH